MIILIALGILALPVIGMAQETGSSMVCPAKEPVADDVALTVCNHLSGMVPRPQPRLYLRLYADGRGEIEIGAPPPRTGPYMKQTLLKKVFHVDADEVAEIRRLGRMADFQSAKDVYRPYAIATDTALSTTVMFNDRGASKKIIVNNFSYSIAYDTKHYGLSFCSLMARVEELRDRGLGIVREPPSISFCELIRHRESYIGWVVAISVFLEYTETQQFIKDPDCAKPSMGSLFTKEKLGVGFDVKGGDAKVIHALKDKAISIRDPRFGGRRSIFMAYCEIIGRERPGCTITGSIFANSRRSTRSSSLTKAGSNPDGCTSTALTRQMKID